MLKYWIIAFVITLAAAYYQRITGPTYPVKAKVATVNGEVVCKLPRSAETSGDVLIEINVPANTRGTLRYKRYNTHDNWTDYSLNAIDGKIKALLPAQPPAGKLVYEIELIQDGKQFELYPDPVVIRFKDPVPA